MPSWPINSHTHTRKKHSRTFAVILLICTKTRGENSVVKKSNKEREKERQMQRPGNEN